MTIKTLLLSSVATVALVATAHAQATPPKPAPELEKAVKAATAPIGGVSETVHKKDFNDLVRQALLENPEILIEAAEKYRENQALEEQVKAKDALKKHENVLFNDGNVPSIGAANADVTIVEFFDYNCGYCHQIMPALAKIVDEDKKVRVVFKEFPILSAESVEASKVALAVNNIAKDKYFAFHQKLMEGGKRFDTIRLLEIAGKLGIDKKKLKAEMESDAVAKTLDTNREIAQDLGIRGTPALIVGGQLFPGAMSYDDIKREVAKARAINATKPKS